MAEEQEPQDEQPGVRPFWSGTITFGLVSIPVELFPASRAQGGVSLRMVSPDGNPLSRRYVCPKHRKELDWDEIVRGYEVDQDEYVVVTEEELERLAPEKTRDIDLRRFVKATELEPIYFERAYFLLPGGNSTKAYRLLAATMEESDRAGIATFVMREKEYLIAITAENGILRAETLRFADEVRTPEAVGLPQPKRAKAAQVAKVEREIARLAKRSLDEDELVDRSTERLLELVHRKEKSGEDVVAPPEDADIEPSEGVIDLMAVLKRSLAEKSEARARGGAKKRTARKGTKSAVRKRTGPTRKKHTA